jgi:exonuclease I
MNNSWYQEPKDMLTERGLAGLDLETTGINRKIEYERPTSAAILESTDNIENPDIVMDNKCRLPYHVLPDAGALRVTNINPMELMNEELSLHQLIRKIVDYFVSNPNKILVTYNGATYDLIILRHSFFSSLHNPYLLSNAFEDRIHIDLYKIAQSIYCFAPKSIAFFKDATGKVVMKQETLAKENGIDPGNAHAALDDVKALLKLANLFEQQAPEIFFSAIASGNKSRAVKLMTEQLYFTYGEVKYKERLAIKRTPTFICEDPTYSNRMIFFDLCLDPNDYLFMTAEEIANLIDKKNSPLFSIKSNSSPVILHPSISDENNLDEELATHRASIVQASNGFKQNVYLACDIMSKKRTPWTILSFPESRIYAKFIDKTDRLLCDAFLNSININDRLEIVNQLNDDRLIDFAKRILALEHQDCGPKLIMEYQEFEAMRLLNEGEVPWRTLKKGWQSLEKEVEGNKLSPSLLKGIKEYYTLVENKVS